MRFSAKMLDADGLINPYIEFDFSDIANTDEDTMYVGCVPVILSSVLAVHDINEIAQGIYWQDPFASWGATPWGDKLVIHLTINGITRSATGATEYEALSNAWKYFNI